MLFGSYHRNFFMLFFFLWNVEDRNQFYIGIGMHSFESKDSKKVPTKILSYKILWNSSKQKEALRFSRKCHRHRWYPSPPDAFPHWWRWGKPRFYRCTWRDGASSLVRTRSWMTCLPERTSMGHGFVFTFFSFRRNMKNSASSENLVR